MRAVLIAVLEAATIYWAAPEGAFFVESDGLSTWSEMEQTAGVLFHAGANPVTDIADEARLCLITRGRLIQFEKFGRIVCGAGAPNPCCKTAAPALPDCKPDKACS